MSVAEKKISLNFKRVTAAQAEALAEGTLVTGGFNLPQHKERARRLQTTIDNAERAERRMQQERKEAEYRRLEADRRQREEEARKRRVEDEARRDAAEAAARRRMEEDRRRQQESGGWFGSRKPAPRTFGSGSTNSGW